MNDLYFSKKETEISFNCWTDWNGELSLDLMWLVKILRELVVQGKIAV